MARLRYSQGLGTVRVQRDEELMSHIGRTILILVAVLGGLALLGWVFFGGFTLGERSSSSSFIPTPTRIEVLGLERTAAAIEAVAGKLPEKPLIPSALGEAEEVGVEPLPKPKPKSLWDLNP